MDQDLNPKCHVEMDPSWAKESRSTQNNLATDHEGEEPYMGRGVARSTGHVLTEEDHCSLMFHKGRRGLINHTKKQGIYYTVSARKWLFR